MILRVAPTLRPIWDGSTCQECKTLASIAHRVTGTYKLAHREWWFFVWRLDLSGMDESAKNARLQPAWLTGSQGHTNWTSMSDDSSSSVYPQTCLRWMNLPRMQDSSRHSSETQTSPLWLVIQLVGIIRIYHPSIKDGKKSRKFYRVLYSNTGGMSGR